jgi:hypothetical protein
MAGHVVLCVNYGMTHTSAVVIGPDGRWLTVPFNDTDTLPSAVFLDANQKLIAGAAAWEHAMTAPERFEAAPARWLQTGTLPLPEPVPVWDAVTATLTLVKQQAHALLGGGPVDEVRIVIPASWGPRRRTALRQAAWQAGLGQPELITVPAAVASWAARSDLPLRIGSFLAVCDLDAAAEVSLLRRTPYEFEVLSVLEVPDGGALAWDAQLAAHLTAMTASTWPGGGLTAWTAAVAARQASQNGPAVTLAGPTGPLVLPAQQVWDAGRPVLQRTGQALTAALAAADLKPADLVGVLCSGDLTSQATVAALTAESGLDVTAVEKPRWAALLGAGHVVTPSATDNTEPPVPPLRRAVSALLPALASAILFIYFLASADRRRPIGTVFASGEGVLLADWGQLALASLFGMLTSLQLATLIAAALPPPDPFTRPHTSGRAAWSDSQQIGPALAASAAAGTTLAGIYAIIAAVGLEWPSGPFLRWTLLPLTPIVVLTLAAGVLATRSRRIPAVGWHEWLGFPVSSIITATIGMAALQASVTTAVYPRNAATLVLLGRVGAALIGVAAALALARQARWRIILAAPTAAIFATIAGLAATGLLASGYITAVTLWWARRVWLLANRPRSALETLH